MKFSNTVKVELVDKYIQEMNSEESSSPIFQPSPEQSADASLSFKRLTFEAVFNDIPQIQSPDS